MSPTPREAFRQQTGADGETRPSGPDWLMTFADTMSLLLGFFVLLLSFSTFDETQFQAIAGGMQATFGGQRPPEPVPPEPAAKHIGLPGDAPLALPEAATRDALRGSIEQWDRETRGAMALRVFASYRGLEVTVPADRIFAPETDRVLPSAAGFFEFVSRALGTVPPDRRLVIIVPQGPSAPASPQFEDAWALAMARSLAARQSTLAGLSTGAGHRVIGAVSGDAAPSAAELTLLFESPDVRPGP